MDQFSDIGSIIEIKRTYCIKLGRVILEREEILDYKALLKILPGKPAKEVSFILTRQKE